MSVFDVKYPRGDKTFVSILSCVQERFTLIFSMPLTCKAGHIYYRMIFWEASRLPSVTESPFLQHVSASMEVKNSVHCFFRCYDTTMPNQADLEAMTWFCSHRKSYNVHTVADGNHDCSCDNEIRFVVADIVRIHCNYCLSWFLLMAITVIVISTATVVTTALATTLASTFASSFCFKMSAGLFRCNLVLLHSLFTVPKYDYCWDFPCIASRILNTALVVLVDTSVSYLFRCRHRYYVSANNIIYGCSD